MPSIGPLELVVVLVIALVVLGPKRLPSTPRSVSKGLRELRDGLAETVDGVDVRLADLPAGSASGPDRTSGEQ